LNGEICGLDWRGIATEYTTRVYCIHMYIVSHILQCVAPCMLFGSEYMSITKLKGKELQTTMYT